MKTSTVTAINRQCRYDVYQKSDNQSARNAFSRPPYSQNETSFREVLRMFKLYPKGMQIRLCDDYPQDIHIVSGYHQICGNWYVDFLDGVSVCVEQLKRLIVT